MRWRPQKAWVAHISSIGAGAAAVDTGGKHLGKSRHTPPLAATYSIASKTSRISDVRG
jgi:hypothetical protein